MAGVVSPIDAGRGGRGHAPRGTRGHATLNEGLGKVLRFGAYDETVLTRLRWMATTLGPALVRGAARAVARSTCAA